MPALYRQYEGADWIEVWLLGRHSSGKLALRETGRFYNGVFLASAEHVRVPASSVFLQLQAA